MYTVALFTKIHNTGTHTHTYTQKIYLQKAINSHIFYVSKELDI